MKSKRDLIADMVNKAIDEAIKDIAFANKDHLPMLKYFNRSIQLKTSDRLCYDKYRWLELQDIMAWRKRKVSE